MRYLSSVFLASALGLSVVNFAILVNPEFKAQVKQLVGQSSAEKKADTTTGVDWVTPTIQGYGRIHYDHNVEFQPDVSQQQKVVFAISKGQSDPKKANDGLDHIARIINLYVAAGVPAEQLQLAGVISGSATNAVLTNEEYKARFGVDNPNISLIQQLRAHNVDLSVCAQSVYGHKENQERVLPEVRMGLSAMITVANFEKDGYALLSY